MSEFLRACLAAGIPRHMAEKLTGYVLGHQPVGDFLTAVLENNLLQAACRADHINEHLLKAYVQVLYNEAPSTCWGSPEKVAQWLDLSEDVEPV